MSGQARNEDLLRWALALAWLGLGAGALKIALDLLADRPPPGLAPAPVALGITSLLLTVTAVLRGARPRRAITALLSSLGAVLIVPLAYYALAALVLAFLILAVVNG